MSRHAVPWVRRSTAAALAAVIAGVGPTWQAAAAGDVDPPSLPRGENPEVVYLTYDMIRDAGKKTPATRLGRHVELWVTRRGYVLQDALKHHRFRLVHVDRQGHKRLIDAYQGWAAVSVSPSGSRIAWARAARPDGPPSVVTVVDPDTGRVVAHDRFPRVRDLLGVTHHRVLLTRWTPALGHSATWWWDYRRGTTTRVSRQQADRVDIRHDRIVFRTGDVDRFCGRVARLSHPHTTLWRTCNAGMGPRAWSPDGHHALATLNYLDDAGTTLWASLSDPGGHFEGEVTGRLGWNATWEDDSHVLVVAENGGGTAAIVRCHVGEMTCERASRIWDLGPVDFQPNYIPPPVLLPSN